MKAWLFLIFTVVLGLCTTATSFGQTTLTSDQADYVPGSTATLTGSGFGENDQVTLQVSHVEETSETGTNHEPWVITADAAGNFVTTWYVCEDDCVGATLRATAVGASGASAETTFTDGPPPPACSTCAASLKTGNIPSTGKATIDGNPNEWTEGDLFANMYEAGNPDKELLSKAYVRSVLSG